MSDFPTLEAQKRSSTGKGVARRLRVSGFVPAIFYNAQGESQPIQVNEKELTRLYQRIGRTSLFNLEIDDNGKKEVSPALFWDVEYFPVKNRIQHIDIYGVDLDKEVKVCVPLVYQGVAQGTKVGGKLETFLEKIDVCCKPLSLPAKIDVDISGLGLNQSLRVSDLDLGEGVKAETAANMVLISVITRGAEDKEGEADA